MSRGRKPISNTSISWESTFYNSVGKYIQLINVELSKNIKQEPLSKHIKIEGGYAFKSSNYISDGIPVIRISDFSDEKIKLDQVKYYKESDDLKKYELYPGDIVIALTGGTIAKLGIVQNGIGKLYLNQRVGKFKILNPIEFENEYIYWIARSVQTIIKELAWGAAIPNVSPKQIEKLRFPIPEKSIQKRIITFLNDLRENKIIPNKIYFKKNIEKRIVKLQQNQFNNSKISSNLTHQQSLLKKLRQQILQEAIEGKLTKDWRNENPNVEPASELLKQIKTEKDQLIKKKKIKKQKPLPPISEEEKPFEIPETWDWCRLGEICNTITKGSSPKWQGVNYVDSYEKGILFITSKNVDSYRIDLSHPTFVEERFNEIEPRSKLEKGDILTNIVGASIGRTAIYDLDFTSNINQAVCILRYKHNFFLKSLLLKIMNADFIIHLMLEMQFSPGRANLSMSNLAKFPIAVPPISEQKAIVEKVEKLFAICDTLEKEINENKIHSEQLMQAVLREAFEGDSNE